MKFEVDHAGSDPNRPSSGRDIADLVPAREIDDDPSKERRRFAVQRRSGSSGNQGDPVSTGPPHEIDHVVRIDRSDRREGTAADVRLVPPKAIELGTPRDHRSSYGPVEREPESVRHGAGRAAATLRLTGTGTGRPGDAVEDVLPARHRLH